MIGSVKRKNRLGKEVYVCPLCGHVFSDSKKYTRHLNKSHLRNVTKNKRKRKKLIKKLFIIKIKEESGVELTKKDKLLKLISNLNNIKL